MVSSRIQLKPGKERSLLRKHPWIFSGAIERVFGDPLNGSTVAVIGHKDEFLGWGTYSKQSKIQVRLWSWDELKPIDHSLIRLLVQQAFDARSELVGLSDTNSFRIVHGESDGIPGLIVDRYDDFLVIQSLSAGVEFWLNEIVESLVDVTGFRNIYERSDVEIRLLEGLPSRKGVLRGDQPPGFIEISEGKAKFLVDIKTGQKTGFYLDQRDNRNILRNLARDREILDCFCYTGGFTINALLGNPKEVTVIDSASKALEVCKRNVEINGFSSTDVGYIEGDVSQLLRVYRDRGRFFDLIILDPPKFAHNLSQVDKASRGYKDINLLAMKLLRPGGLLLTFSCSGNISLDLFQKILAGAALDAGGNFQILQTLHQATDHLVSLNFPEGTYLKGLLIRKS